MTSPIILIVLILTVLLLVDKITVNVQKKKQNKELE